MADMGRIGRLNINKINGIETDTTYENTWEPDPNWWDIDKILEEDTENYPAKAIVLVNDSTDDYTLYGATKYKTNEGTFNGDTISSTKITFKGTNDKVSSYGYKTRYIIYYYTSTNLTISSVFLPSNTLYAIIDKAQLNQVTNFKSYYILECLKFKNGSKFIDTNWSQAFDTTHTPSMRKIENLDVSSATTLSDAFKSSSIESVELDLSRNPNVLGMLDNTPNLKQVKLKMNNSASSSTINLNKITYAPRREINIELSGAIITTDFIKDVENCNKLSIDCTNDYNIKMVQCRILENKNTAKTLTINGDNNSYKRGFDVLEELIGNFTIDTDITMSNNQIFRNWNNLIERLQGSHILTLGTYNEYKLNQEQKQTIQNKGWTIK